MASSFLRAMRRGAAALCAALALCGCLWGAAAERRTVVRVGYAELPGFLSQDEQGQYTGYAYDLLQEIAGYTGWDYEFVRTPYSEIDRSFREGSIDLFIPYQKTAERAELYEYSQEPFCTNQASLLTSPDADLYYNDFSHFDGLVIGAARGTRNGERFREYLAQHRCHVTLRQDYVSVNDMKAALDRGVIDAFVCASNRGVDNCKVICSLEPTQSYVLAPKGNRTLLLPLDEAMRKIQQNTPLFASQLEEKYRVSADGSYPSLTREEANYIVRRGIVTVMVDGQDYDARTGGLSGSAQKVFSLLANRTGLSFRAVTASPTEQLYRDFTDGKADVFFAFDSDYDWARAHNARLTTKYASFDGILIRKSGQTDAPRTIAAVRGSYAAAYLRQHTKYTAADCGSYEDGLRMVRSGEADALLCNSRVGNYYASLPQYGGLTFTTTYEFTDHYCLAVSDSCADTLAGILDKGIQSIPQATLNACFTLQTASSGPASFSDYLYENPTKGALILVGVFSVLLSLLFLGIFTVSTRRKNRQLIAASRAKTDFLSRMSHDMRTPLNGILGLTELMENTEDLNVIRDDLTQMRLSGRYLLNLVNDTLDVSKIEQGRLELHPVVCRGRDALENALNLVRPNLEAKHIALRVDVSAVPFTTLYIDAGRVEQLFMNILSNCIKFTPEGGSIDFRMENLSCTDNVLFDQVTIRDTGVGISPEFLPHIFEPFSQENNSVTSRYSGSGLGMTICKQIVELMGGTISVHSEKGKGTEFVFTLRLPIATREQIDAQQARNVTQQDLCVLRGKRMLLCEDNALNAQIAVLLLQEKGVSVDWEEDGKRGLDRYLASPPGTYAAILMDIRMPVMDGLEAARRIRASGQADAASIPILAMTANAFDEDIRETQRAGMNAHLSKPIDVNTFFAALAEWVARSGRQTDGEKPDAAPGT